MNAHATALQPAIPRIDSAPKSEHISIEVEPEASLAPSHPPHRAVRSTLRLGSKLRGCRTEISILEDHYLAVKSERPKAALKKYVLDLRFVDARPVCVRRIAWNWLAAAIVLFLASAAAIWWTATSTVGALATPLVVSAVCVLATGIAAFSFLRRTTESLDFISVHGGATLVSTLGGIGSAKAGKRFFVEMIKNINAAKLARPQPKPQWLRDEMREHHRLRELKVLSEEAYEMSKRKILAAHS